MVAGNQYTVDVTYSSGAPPMITPFVVVYDASFTPLFFGTSPVAFTAPSSGTYYTIPFADAFCTSFDPNFGCNSTLWSNTTSTLPVELSNFYGLPQTDFNTLRWETNSEVNNDYFNILRSNDGITFENIGMVDGAGSSQDIIQYQFHDFEVRSETVYYQLEQVDLNGDSEKSALISLKRTLIREEPITAFPTPTTGIVTIEVNDPNGSLATLTLTDVNGILIDQKVALAGGIKQYQFDLCEMTQGIYFVSYQDGRSAQTIKVVKY
ncbi:MAG: hypothetical protein Crog4KO_26190 [Crocinitomicaceae bacterium]